MDHSEVKHFPKVDHTPAQLDEEAKLLLKAAALIEERGHCKYALRKGESFCIGGAINFACSGDVFNAGRTANDAMARMHQAVGGNFLPWNNASERTKEEVVAKLRAVALGL